MTHQFCKCQMPNDRLMTHQGSPNSELRITKTASQTAFVILHSIFDISLIGHSWVIWHSSFLGRSRCFYPQSLRRLGLSRLE